MSRAGDHHPAAGNRKVLMITPHFPPDSSAGTHRVRLLAPNLSEFGWTPTVLTVHPKYLTGRLDQRLAESLSPGLRVETATAISHTVSRLAGVGDLGLRAFTGLYRKAAFLLSSDHYDLVFITIYPAYTALLGPLLKRRFGLPFVLDYQDPWVGSWGLTVGGSRDGRPDFKSRASRRLALFLEPFAVRSADAITAVSAATLHGVAERLPEVVAKPFAEIPIGADPSDFDNARKLPPHDFFDPEDGCFHICYVGTLLPMGVETLNAVFLSAAQLKTTRTDLYRRLRFHFFGTSNQSTHKGPGRVMAHAQNLGVSEIVTERPARLDYFDAIGVQKTASALLLIGSSERHYTPSKVFPALLSKRPILAIYHHDSTACTILGNANAKHVSLVTFGDNDPAESHVSEIAEAIVHVMEHGSPAAANANGFDESFSARQLACRMAETFDRACSLKELNKA